jgi:hypothetical protein
MAEPAPHGIQTMKQQLRQFPNAGFPDVIQTARHPGIDVKAFDAMPVGFSHPNPLVASKAVKHQFDHVTLAMMRWRNMGKHQQFHVVISGILSNWNPDEKEVSEICGFMGGWVHDGIVWVSQSDAQGEGVVLSSELTER